MALHLKLSNSKGLHRALFILFFAFFLLSLMSCENGLSKMRERLLSKWDKYTITLTQPASGGTISATIGGVATEIPQGGKLFSQGTVIIFTVNLAPDYWAGTWSGATVSDSDVNVATLTVSEDATISVGIIPAGFVEVVTPEGAFTTTLDTSTDLNSDNPIAANSNSYKGVFYKDRNVKLSSFCIGKTEVTYELWKEVYDWAIGDAGGQGQPAVQYSFAHAGWQGSDDNENNNNHPVTLVSWRDCVVWCNAYTEKFMGQEHCVYRIGTANGTVIRSANNTTGVDNAFVAMDKKGFRLPTEAEWEFAARYEKDNTENLNETGVPYSDGIYLTKLTFASGATADYTDTAATGEVAWYRDNSTVGGMRKTHAVGTTSVATNNLDLSDMSGNVWEWCFDRWGYGNPTANDGAYTEGGVVVDPLGAGSGSGSARVFRGGSCYSVAEDCAVGYRRNNSPDYSYGGLGFRLACRP